MTDDKSPLCEYIVELEDDRHLGVAEYGCESGVPVFWFHGTPGARHQVPIAARRYAAKMGVRIICTERPGIGQSTKYLYSKVVDWADDIRQLADLLELDKFGLVGLSGGGPYVLACAHEFEDRIIGGAVFGGVAPTLGEDAPTGGLTHKAVSVERLLTRTHKLLGGMITQTVKSLHPFADPIFDFVIKNFPGPETDMLAKPEVREMFLADILEGSKHNLHSAVYDVILFARHWGFSVRQIKAPIHFWHGIADPMVPFDHATHLARIIPQARVTLCPDDGHLAGLETTIEAIDFILSHHPASHNLHASNKREQAAV